MRKMNEAEMKNTNGGYIYCVCSGCGEWFYSSSSKKITATSKAAGYLAYCTHRLDRSKYPKCFLKTPYYYFIVR